MLLWAHILQEYHTKMESTHCHRPLQRTTTVDGCGLAMVHNMNMQATAGQGLLDSMDAADLIGGDPAFEGIYLYCMVRCRERNVHAREAQPQQDSIGKNAR